MQINSGAVGLNLLVERHFLAKLFAVIFNTLRNKVFFRAEFEDVDYLAEVRHADSFLSLG